MERIICYLERIGGYGGKRVCIRRVVQIRKIMNRVYYEITTAKKADILRVHGDSKLLDKFMRLVQLQGERPSWIEEEDYLADISYYNGEVWSIELIQLCTLLEEFAIHASEAFRDYSKYCDEEGRKYSKPLRIGELIAKQRGFPTPAKVGKK